MGKKLKIQKNKSSSDEPMKTIDFSSLINQTNQKLSNQNFPDISLNTVKFDINPNKSELEKQYKKTYITYFREEFNFKIIKMFFNYISSSKVIPQSVKDNRPFLIDFLKIITNLLMNEIDISAMVYLLENKVKWIGENETDLMWNHLYNVCLGAKNITSSKDTFDIIINILDTKNPGYIAYFNKWMKQKKCPDKIDISDINSVYNELMKSNYINQNRSKFINYNEAVNKILEFSEKPKKVKKGKKSKKDDTNNNQTQAPNTNNPELTMQQIPPISQYSGYGQPLSIHNGGSNLNLSNMGSSENFPIFQNQGTNNNLSLYKNYSNCYNNNNYFGLNLVKNDSGKSFNSNMNDQNNDKDNYQ